MANTIDSLGDFETLEALVSGQLTDYTDDTIIVFDSNFRWSSTNIATLNFENLEIIKRGYFATNKMINLNFPKLKYISRESLSSADKLAQLNFPELRAYTLDGSYNSINVLNLPKVKYTCISTPKLATINNLSNIEYIDSNINLNENIYSLKFDKLRYLLGRTEYSTDQGTSTFEYATNLSTVDLTNEDFRFINCTRICSSRSSGLLKLIIRSTTLPELRSTYPMSDNNNFKVQIYVPFFMLSKYLSDAKWSSNNYSENLRSIESISSESNPQILLDENLIPYYQDTIGLTCTLTCDYQDNTTGVTYSDSDISYHMTRDVGYNITNSSISKSVSETYGSSMLSGQFTQSPIDFSNGYSISNLRSYGWKEYSNSEYLPQGFRFLETSKSRYQCGYLENGVSTGLDTFRSSSQIDIKLTSRDITIFINGLSSFDFYLIGCVYLNSYQYIDSSSGNYANYAHTGTFYIGEIDQYDPKLNYKIKYYDRGHSTVGLSSNQQYLDQCIVYKPYSSSSRDYLIKTDLSDINTYWKHIEFTNIDPTTPHFIKIKAELTRHLDLRSNVNTNYLSKYIIAIPDSYNYNALPTLIEDQDE